MLTEESELNPPKSYGGLVRQSTVADKFAKEQWRINPPQTFGG
jgi:hypothetical protein